MNLPELTSYCSQKGLYKILVGGSPRSGTRISASIIAQEMKATFYEEERINIRNVQEALRICADSKNPFVLQCAALTPSFLKFKSLPNVGLIFMIRPLDDIYASMKRLGWKDGREKLKFMHQTYRDCFPNWYDDNLLIPELALKLWNDILKTALDFQAIELEYDSLQDHVQFVKKPLREKWHPRRIKL